VYAIGGYVPNCDCYTNEVDAYSPTSNSWTTVAPMPTPRSAAAAATGSDGKIYVFGGYNDVSSTTIDTVEFYTPSSNSWTTGAPMPTPRDHMTAVTASSGSIYVIGGYDDHTGRLLNTVEKYNPGANSWTTKTSMPTARAHLAGARGSDGRIYAIGGSSDTQFVSNVVEAYDPSHDSWTTAASLPTPREGLAAAALAGNVYAVGGRGSDVSAAVEYLPEQTPAVGTVAINGGAASTNSLSVSVAVPATDTSGVSRVALSNSAATSGGLLSASTIHTYHTPISWDLSDTSTGGNSSTGTHTVYAQWKDGVGNWSDVSSDSIDYETMPQPVTNLSADTSTSGQVTLTWTNPSSLAGDVVRRGSATSCPASVLAGTGIGGTSTRTSQVDASGTVGTTHCWSVFTTDGASNYSTAISVVAQVPSGGGPSLSGINNSLTSTPLTSTGKVPSLTSWVGSDQGATITSYHAQMQTNGGAWTNLTLTSPTATSVTVNLAPGSTYNFRIQASDSLGRTSPWCSGIPFTVNSLQEGSASYAGTWTHQSVTGAWGGAVSYTTQLNASATITFTGRNLAWVGTKGAGYGSAKVYIDGVYLKAIDCHTSSTAKRQVLLRYSTGSFTNSTHTVQIVNLATAGHPRIDIDGFVSFRS
jgi:hypothetical protein